MKRTIGLIGINKVKNIGDPILYKSAEYLINLEKLQDDEIVNINIHGKNENVLAKLLSKIISVVLLALEMLSLKNSELYYFLLKTRVKIVYGGYYKANIVGLDFLIFAGGSLIKYKYEDFSIKIPVIIDYIKKYSLHTKVYFNAVGVEDYSETDIVCQKLKTSLNSDVVKVITTRDDIETIQERYIHTDNIETKLVADSAFWVDEVYKDDITTVREDIIGLGIARKNIFLDNDIDFNAKDIIKFWTSITTELDKRNLKWEFYTNGSEDDNRFMFEVMDQEIYKDRAIQYNIPSDDIDFVNLTNRFSKVLVTRMHASIVAYALNIPSFGLVWNVKIRLLSNLIGHADRYYDVENIDVLTLINDLEKAKYTNDDLRKKESFRLTTRDSLRKFFS